MKLHLTKSETADGIKVPKCGYKNRNRWWVVSENCISKEKFDELVKTKPDIVCKKCQKQ